MMKKAVTSYVNAPFTDCLKGLYKHLIFFSNRAVLITKLKKHILGFEHSTIY